MKRPTLAEAVRIIRRINGRYPENMMGGCAQCGTTERGAHTKRCSWALASDFLARTAKGTAKNNRKPLSHSRGGT